MTVLVADASCHGATQGIAERIAERLRADGLAAEARRAAEARDASRYEAFVVGAADMSHWLRDATRFVQRNRALLDERPTWLFSSGPGGTDTVDKQGRDVPEASASREFAVLGEAIHPRGEKVFFGALDPGARAIGFGPQPTKGQSASTQQPGSAAQRTRGPTSRPCGCPRASTARRERLPRFGRNELSRRR